MVFQYWLEFRQLNQQREEQCLFGSIRSNAITSTESIKSNSLRVGVRILNPFSICISDAFRPTIPVEPVISTVLLIII